MKVIVQKYEGSLLANGEMRQKVTENIFTYTELGYKPIVVVSAMKGSPYATDILLELLKKQGQNLSAREVDLIESCGEIIAGLALVNALAQKGITASYLTGAQVGVITDSGQSSEYTIKVKTDKLLRCLEEDNLVIVTGFQGFTEQGNTTTLGKVGGYDLVAALGKALKTEAIEIYTDVTEIRSTESQMLNELEHNMGYQEILHMAHRCGEVFCRGAVDLTMQPKMPLWLKTTIILDITQFALTFDEERAIDFQRKIFKNMSEANIYVDFINVSPKGASLTVKGKLADQAEKILKLLDITLKRSDNCSKIVAVGAEITGITDIMARVVETFIDVKIKILQMADSNKTFWCIVEQKDMEKAVRALHSVFHLIEEKEAKFETETKFNVKRPG